MAKYVRQSGRQEIHAASAPASSLCSLLSGACFQPGGRGTGARVFFMSAIVFLCFFCWAAIEKRTAEAHRIRAKYPNRIPVICEKAPRSDLPVIDKKK